MLSEENIFKIALHYVEVVWSHLDMLSEENIFKKVILIILKYMAVNGEV